MSEDTTVSFSPSKAYGMEEGPQPATDKADSESTREEGGSEPAPPALGATVNQVVSEARKGKDGSGPEGFINPEPPVESEDPLKLGYMNENDEEIEWTDSTGVDFAPAPQSPPPQDKTGDAAGSLKFVVDERPQEGEEQEEKGKEGEETAPVETPEQVPSAAKGKEALREEYRREAGLGRAIQREKEQEAEARRVRQEQDGKSQESSSKPPERGERPQDRGGKSKEPPERGGRQQDAPERGRRQPDAPGRGGRQQDSLERGRRPPEPPRAGRRSPDHRSHSTSMERTERRSPERFREEGDVYREDRYREDRYRDPIYERDRYDEGSGRYGEEVARYDHHHGYEEPGPSSREDYRYREDRMYRDYPAMETDNRGREVDHRGREVDYRGREVDYRGREDYRYQEDYPPRDRYTEPDRYDPLDRYGPEPPRRGPLLPEPGGYRDRYEEPRSYDGRAPPLIDQYSDRRPYEQTHPEEGVEDDPYYREHRREDPYRDAYAEPPRPRPLLADPARPRPLLADPDRPRPLLADPARPRPLLADPARPRPLLADPDRPRPLLADPDRPRLLLADPARPRPLLPDPDQHRPAAAGQPSELETEVYKIVAEALKVKKRHADPYRQHLEQHNQEEQYGKEGYYDDQYYEEQGYGDDHHGHTDEHGQPYEGDQYGEQGEGYHHDDGYYDDGNEHHGDVHDAGHGHYVTHGHGRGHDAAQQPGAAYLEDEAHDILDDMYDKAQGQGDPPRPPSDMSISSGSPPMSPAPGGAPSADPLDAYLDIQSPRPHHHWEEPPVPPGREGPRRVDPLEAYRSPLRPPSPVRSLDLSDLSELSDDSSVDSVPGGKAKRPRKGDKKGEKGKGEKAGKPSDTTQTGPQFASFISSVLKAINPNLDEQRLKAAVMPVSREESSQPPPPPGGAQTGPDLYDPSEPTPSQGSDIPHLANCPLCVETLDRVQAIPLPQAKKLKEHVMSFHLPWYVSVSQYDPDGEGKDPRRCRLADQLHPVLKRTVSRVERMSPFFTRLWGKLMHGLLEHLSRQMELQNVFQLEMTVMMKALHPPKGLMSDLTLNMATEEKIVMNSHQMFVDDFSRELEVAPPNCLSAVLHWVTLTNILCQLTKEQRVAVATHAPFTSDSLIQMPAPSPDDAYNYSVIVKFFESVTKGNVEHAVNLASQHPKLLGERHFSGLGPAQLALDKHHHHAARALLLCGADPDHQCQNGWYPLSHFARAGDTEAVRILLAWDSKMDAPHALTMATTGNHTEAAALLQQSLAAPVKKQKPAASAAPGNAGTAKHRAGVPVSMQLPGPSAVQRSSDPAPGLSVAEGDELGTETCELCLCYLPRDVAQKSHFISVHLPWYLSVNHSRRTGSGLYRVFRPALHSYVKHEQAPFEMFAKMWGKLLHGFLQNIATLLKLSEPSDLIWYVTQKRYTPAKGTQATFVERIMMKTLQLHIGEDDRQLVLAPPNCLGAVLHWHCLSNIFAELSPQARIELAAYEKYPDVETLRHNVLPLGYKAAVVSAQAQQLKRHQFWGAVEGGQMSVLWKLVLDNPEFVNVYGDSDANYCPVQCAVTHKHPSTARLLMFYGSTTERKDIEGFTPLWRAAALGDADTVTLLLPWVSKEQKMAAVAAARRRNHEHVVRAIKKFLSREGAITSSKEKGDKRAADEGAADGAQPPKVALMDAGSTQPGVWSQAPTGSVAYTPGMPASVAPTATSAPYPVGVAPPVYAGGVPPPGGVAPIAPPGVATSYPQPVATPTSGYMIPYGQFPYNPTPPPPPTQPPPPPPLAASPGKEDSLSISDIQAISQLGLRNNLVPLPEVRPAGGAMSLTPQAPPAEEDATYIEATPMELTTPLDSAGTPELALPAGAGVSDGVCPLCDQKFLDTMGKKYHVTMTHLPWYFALLFHRDERFPKTKLARQLLPHLGPSFSAGSKKPPFGLFFKLLGKLLHGFLEMLRKFLALGKVDDLVDYVRDRKLYPNRDVSVMDDDKLLIRAHRDFVGHTRKSISTSPPNCASALLHWTTVSNIAAHLPDPARASAHKFERFHAGNIIDKRMGEAATPITPELIIRLQRSVVENDLYTLWQLLDDSPQLAATSMMTMEGISPVEFAVSNGRFDAAAVLCFYGAIVDQSNLQGYTALKTEARRGSIEAVTFLVNWGASYQLQESIDVAKLHGHTEVVHRLKTEQAELRRQKGQKPRDQVDPMEEAIQGGQAGADPDVPTEQCPLCSELLTMEHALMSHLPWYAGLQLRPRTDKELVWPNMTPMAIKMLKLTDVSRCNSLPEQYLIVLGKLLHDLLDFVTSTLELVSQEGLLHYVLEQKLWDPHVAPDDRVLLRYIVPAYQLYTRTRGSPTFSPPNCVPAVLHWKTLLRLCARLPEYALVKLYTYETFCWMKGHPSLPSLDGPRRQPETGARDANKVPHFSKLSFLKLITFGYADITHVSVLVSKHPALVLCDTKSKAGVIQHILFYNRLPGISSSKALLFKLLVLAGASTGQLDSKGWTALHVAAMRNDLFSAALLLLWDANINAKGPYGQKPMEVARKKGHHEIVEAIKLAERGNLTELVAYCSPERMNSCRKAYREAPAPSLAPEPRTPAYNNPADDDEDNDAGGFDAPSGDTGPPPPAGNTPSMGTPNSGMPSPARAPTPAPEPLPPPPDNPCPLCPRDPYNMAHVLKTHLPWYAGLQCKWPVHKPDPRRTRLSMSLLRGIYIGEKRKKSLPTCFKLIIGKLLKDMLDFLASGLGLLSQKALLQYVMDNRLWSKIENKREDVVLYDVTVASLQAHIGMKDEVVTHNPPNCVAGLLHWETLLNVLIRMPPAEQEKLRTLETFTWSKDNPQLPLSRGLIRQPATTRQDVGSVPYGKRQQFTQALMHGRIENAVELVTAHPELVFMRSDLPVEAGVIAQALILNRNTSSTGKCLLAKILLLYGARIDEKDGMGQTALHHAVGRNQLQALVTLLLWGADDSVRSREGKTAYERARDEGLSDMCRIFDMAKRDALEEIYAVPTEIMRDCTSNKTGFSGGSIFPGAGDTTATTTTARGRAPEPSRSFPPVAAASTPGAAIPAVGAPPPAQAASRKRRWDPTPTDTRKSRDDRAKWKCPVCHTATYSGRLHALEHHLPWYVSLGTEFQHLINGTRRTKLAAQLSPSLVSVAHCKDLGYAGSADNTQTPCFLHLMGRLHHGLLCFMAFHLHLDGPAELLAYVNRRKIWPVLQATLLPPDNYSIKAFQLFIDDERADVDIAPPNHVSTLVHWHTLLNLIARLPEPVQKAVLTYENYSVPRTECRISSVMSEQGQPQLKMATPPCTGVPASARTELCAAILASNINSLCRVLEDWPALAYYPNSRMKSHPNAPPMWFALANNQYLVPPVLFLYGASPDQLDGAGWTPLHSAVKKGDLKAVQTLLSLDARLDFHNPEGQTPLDLAKKMRLNKITTLLEDRQKEQEEEAERDWDQEKKADPEEERSAALWERLSVTHAPPYVLRKTGDAPAPPDEPPAPVPWACPVCGEVLRRGSGRYHAASHLPWYACLTGAEPGETDSQLCRMLLPPLTHSVLLKGAPPSECFLRVWGELLAAFLRHLCAAVGVKDTKHLLTFMTSHKLWPGPDTVVTGADKLAGYALEKGLGLSRTRLSLAPPYTPLAVMHWASLLRLLARVPGPLRAELRAHEEYTLKKPECQFTPYNKPGLSKVLMRMTKPSLERVSSVVKEDFVSAVRRGRLDLMCRILERHPAVVYYPFPEQDNPGVIRLLLDKDDHDMALAARIYGADPDYRDRYGQTALHRFAEKDHLRNVKFLLMLGSSPLLTHTDGKTTPAMLAQEQGAAKTHRLLRGEERKRRRALMIQAGVPLPEGLTDSEPEEEEEGKKEEVEKKDGVEEKEGAEKKAETEAKSGDAAEEKMDTAEKPAPGGVAGAHAGTPSSDDTETDKLVIDESAQPPTPATGTAQPAAGAEERMDTIDEHPPMELPPSVTTDTSQFPAPLVIQPLPDEPELPEPAPPIMQTATPAGIVPSAAQPPPVGQLHAVTPGTQPAGTAASTIIPAAQIKKEGQVTVKTEPKDTGYGQAAQPGGATQQQPAVASAVPAKPTPTTAQPAPATTKITTATSTATTANNTTAQAAQQQQKAPTVSKQNQPATLVATTTQPVARPSPAAVVSQTPVSRPAATPATSQTTTATPASQGSTTAVGQTAPAAPVSTPPVQAATAPTALSTSVAGQPSSGTGLAAGLSSFSWNIQDVAKNIKKEKDGVLAPSQIKTEKLDGANASTVTSTAGAHTSTATSTTGAHTSTATSTTGAHTSTATSTTGAHTSTATSTTGVHTSTVTSTTGAKASTVTSTTGAKASTVTSTTGVHTSTVTSTTGAHTSTVTSTTTAKPSTVTSTSLANIGTTSANTNTAPSNAGTAVVKPTVTSQTTVPSVTSQSAAPSVTSQSAAPPTMSQSAAPSVTSQSAAPSVTSQSAAPPTMSQSAAPSVTSQSAAPTTTSKPTAPTTTSQTLAPTVTSQSTVPPVSSQLNAVTVKLEPREKSSSSADTAAPVPAVEPKTAEGQSSDIPATVAPPCDNTSTLAPPSDTSATVAPSSDNTAKAPPPTDNTSTVAHPGEDTATVAPLRVKIEAPPRTDNTTTVMNPSDNKATVASPSETTIEHSGDNTAIQAPPTDRLATQEPPIDNSGDISATQEPPIDNSAVSPGDNSATVAPPGDNSATVTPPSDNLATVAPPGDNPATVAPPGGEAAEESPEPGVLSQKSLDDLARVEQMLKELSGVPTEPDPHALTESGVAPQPAATGEGDPGSPERPRYADPLPEDEYAAMELPPTPKDMSDLDEEPADHGSRRASADSRPVTPCASPLEEEEEEYQMPRTPRDRSESDGEGYSSAAHAADTSREVITLSSGLDDTAPSGVDTQSEGGELADQSALEEDDVPMTSPGSISPARSATPVGDDSGTPVSMETEEDETSDAGPIVIDSSDYQSDPAHPATVKTEAPDTTAPRSQDPGHGGGNVGTCDNVGNVSGHTGARGGHGDGDGSPAAD